MSLWRQPKPVLSVAFACVIAFMGIGLVDPILKPIADSLGATPSQTALLFTSYMAVMGVSMIGPVAVSHGGAPAVIFLQDKASGAYCSHSAVAHDNAVLRKNDRRPEGLRPKIAPYCVARLDLGMTKAGTTRLVWNDFGVQRAVAGNGNRP